MKAKTSSFRLGEDVPAASTQAPPPGLVLVYAAPDADLAGAYPLAGPITVVGRDDAHVVLAHDEGVSGRHAMLRWDEGQLVVEDLGSRNGTFVNGERRAAAPLGEHDVVRFGATLFRVALEDVTGYRAYRLDGTRAGDSPSEAAARSARPFVGGHRIDTLLARLEEVAPSSLTVLLLGESGTGKEVFARRVHEKSGRTGAFVAINCASLPEGLIEAELFGARKGAYSGAHEDRPGRVRAAHLGTLFLDEIGDMPPGAQARLLRVLQEREVQPLGASRPEKVDVRVVAATHRDLGDLVRRGQFRGDLLSRLCEQVTELPRLTERREDLMPLCRALLAKYGRPDLLLTPRVAERLLTHGFTYNVRELENLLKRVAAVTKSDARAVPIALVLEELQSGLLSERRAEPAPPKTLSSKQVEAAEVDREAPVVSLQADSAPREGASEGSTISPELLRGMLAFHKGNLNKTCRAFEIGRSVLYRLMREQGIDAEDYR